MDAKPNPVVGPEEIARLTALLRVYAQKWDVLHRDIADDFRMAADLCDAFTTAREEIAALKAQLLERSAAPDPQGTCPARPEAELVAAIERKIPLLELYQRVHGELDAGKAWTDIDHGLRRKVSYNGWLAYMQQSLINGLKDVVLTYRYSHLASGNAAGRAENGPLPVSEAERGTTLQASPDEKTTT